MADVVYLAVMIGFFALCAVFVRACDSIIGPDETPPAAAPDREDTDAANATSKPGADSSTPVTAGTVSA